MLKFVIHAIVFIYFISDPGEFVAERHVSANPCSAIVSRDHPNSSNHTHLHLLRHCHPLPDLLPPSFHHHLHHVRGTRAGYNDCCGLFAKSPAVAIIIDSGVVACKDSIVSHHLIPLHHRIDTELHETRLPGNFHCKDHQLINEDVVAEMPMPEFHQYVDRRHHHRHLHLHHRLRSLTHTSHTSVVVPVTLCLLWSKVGLAFLSPRYQSKARHLSGQSALQFHAVFHYTTGQCRSFHLATGTCLSLA